MPNPTIHNECEDEEEYEEIVTYHREFITKKIVLLLK